MRITTLTLAIIASAVSALTYDPPSVSYSPLSPICGYPNTASVPYNVNAAATTIGYWINGLYFASSQAADPKNKNPQTSQYTGQYATWFIREANPLRITPAGDITHYIGQDWNVCLNGGEPDQLAQNSTTKSNISPFRDYCTENNLGYLVSVHLFLDAASGFGICAY